MAQRAYDEAVRFTKERTAFGKKVFEFQNTRFTLADLKARLQVGWAHLDWALARHVRKELTADEAAAAKLFHTELLWEVCDTSLQLHGGAGYMNEYLIARMWRDARVMRIFGGSSEIMKELMRLEGQAGSGRSSIRLSVRRCFWQRAGSRWASPPPRGSPVGDCFAI
jgi:long-chain-acyl-CoA dehydrogenase